MEQVLLQARGQYTARLLESKTIYGKVMITGIKDIRPAVTCSDDPAPSGACGAAMLTTWLRQNSV
jgi:hypothetical protein